jgi:hypothetical protein
VDNNGSNTVVTGTLDQSTGIFTGNNGHDYFVSQDGIIPVTPQSWSVDLGQFSDAMTVVYNASPRLSTVP